jgi:outer membrane protein assembly factor BamE (lipoprotein component of BamABCDE complex)
MPFAARAQNKAAIEKKLTSEYALTQATADQTDIVTAGAILVLKKGNVVMGPSTQTTLYQSTYKDGKVSPNFAGKLNNGLTRLGRLPGQAPPQNGTRTFVPGEKVWVTKIECKDDGVVFDLFTDAYADVRYRAALKFAFDKHGSIPTADQMSAMVGEVFKVQPAEDTNGGGEQQQQQAAAPPARGQRPAAPQAAPPPAAAPEPALAPIAPPPPPVDEPQGPPKELKIGQTKDQVIANFGQPEKVVKLGTKEIYYYKDLGKVTFVSGKVTDVQ